MAGGQDLTTRVCKTCGWTFTTAEWMQHICDDCRENRYTEPDDVEDDIPTIEKEPD